VEWGQGAEGDGGVGWTGLAWLGGVRGGGARLSGVGEREVPRPQHTPVAKLPCLIKDLPNKFPRRSQHKDKWLGLVSAFEARFCPWGFKFEGLAE